MTLNANPLGWPLEHWESWVELAARIEYDGEGCTREEAERRAEAMVRRQVAEAERVVYPAHRATG